MCFVCERENEVMKDITFICGAIDGTGKVVDGACGKPVDMKHGFRCAECGVFLHLDCARTHFDMQPVEEAVFRITNYKNAVTNTVKHHTGTQEELIDELTGLMWHQMEMQKRVTAHERTQAIKKIVSKALWNQIDKHFPPVPQPKCK